MAYAVATFVNGKLHSINDQPALVITIIWCDDIIQKWYDNGRKHRTHSPAVISNCQHAYYLHGVKHRDNGPAVCYGAVRLFYMFGNLSNIKHNAWFLNSRTKLLPDGSIDYFKPYWTTNGVHSGWILESNVVKNITCRKSVTMRYKKWSAQIPLAKKYIYEIHLLNEYMPDE